MIVGNGMVAAAFAPIWRDDAKVCILAAGVSNSREIDPTNFMREENVVRSALEAGHAMVVYFGSCAVGNPKEVESPYLLHKRRMERLVLAHACGRVLRLPQVVGWGGNPGTLTNFLRDRILRGERFEVWQKAERNIIDVEDVCVLATHVIRHHGDYPNVLSLADPRSTPMPHIVRAMEDAIGKAGNYSLTDNGYPFIIDTRDCIRAADAVGLTFDSGYCRNVIAKYYSAH